MSFTSLATRRTVLGAAAVLSMVGAGVAAAPLASAAAVPGTLSAVSGPDAGGNSLTLTTATKVFSGTTTAVQFVYNATTCPAAYTAPVSPSTDATVVKLLTGQKLAFTVPAGVTVQNSAASSAYMVCVYPNSTSGAVSASAKYTVAAAPTIASSSAILPASGPALGGGTVTITGTNFSTGTTAKIGTQPLTNVTVVNATTLTGTVPAQAAGTAQAISVTNTGGTATKASAYTYVNGIVISPSTAPGGAVAGPTDIDVQGVGFSGLAFSATTGTTSNSANAHVYLVKDAYNATGFAAGTTNKTNGQSTECVNVLVISDGELICTVDTSKKITTTTGTSAYATGTLADGGYTMTVVNDGAATTPTYKTVVSSGAAFTVADF